MSSEIKTDKFSLVKKVASAEEYEQMYKNNQLPLMILFTECDMNLSSDYMNELRFLIDKRDKTRSSFKKQTCSCEMMFLKRHTSTGIRINNYKCIINTELNNQEGRILLLKTIPFGVEIDKYIDGQEDYEISYIDLKNSFMPSLIIKGQDGIEEELLVEQAIRELEEEFKIKREKQLINS